jgi:hypothetical protein
MAVLYKSGTRSPPSVGPDRDLGVVLEILGETPEDPE